MAGKKLAGVQLFRGVGGGIETVREQKLSGVEEKLAGPRGWDKRFGGKKRILYGLLRVAKASALLGSSCLARTCC